MIALDLTIESGTTKNFISTSTSANRNRNRNRNKNRSSELELLRQPKGNLSSPEID